jgi:hypothetical protein
LGEERNPKVPTDPETALELLLAARDARELARAGIVRVPLPLDPESALQRLIAGLPADTCTPAR